MDFVFFFARILVRICACNIDHEYQIRNIAPLNGLISLINVCVFAKPTACICMVLRLDSNSDMAAHAWNQILKVQSSRKYIVEKSCFLNTCALDLSYHLYIHTMLKNQKKYKMWHSFSHHSQKTYFLSVEYMDQFSHYLSRFKLVVIDCKLSNLHKMIFFVRKYSDYIYTEVLSIFI